MWVSDCWLISAHGLGDIASLCRLYYGRASVNYQQTRRGVRRSRLVPIEVEYAEHCESLRFWIIELFKSNCLLSMSAAALSLALWNFVLPYIPHSLFRTISHYFSNVNAHSVIRLRVYPAKIESINTTNDKDNLSSHNRTAANRTRKGKSPCLTILCLKRWSIQLKSPALKALKANISSPRKLSCKLCEWRCRVLF